MMTRIRSKVGKCFRMNAALHVGAQRSLVARLPWAQEVSGSNPDAPTKNISRVFFYLLKAPFTSNPVCGIPADRSA